MLERILGLAVGNLGGRIEQELKAVVAPLAPYVRRLSIGGMLVVLSAGLWLLCLLFILGALFFSLGQLALYSHAALWTALATAGLAGTCLGIGLSLLKKPR